MTGQCSKAKRRSPKQSPPGAGGVHPATSGLCPNALGRLRQASLGSRDCLEHLFLQEGPPEAGRLRPSTPAA
ncbi:hypothetical protein NDU88_005244 [Pleurodeles waltl]|uniref:Uncharacterized protein n=1 Tax=Pleurodeles waltl TaxID=8319 RepID=A0AAV7SL95_PLEWA|nr:hypothetical protein NDU88_005244 [Pleurodeles waltl]